MWQFILKMNELFQQEPEQLLPRDQTPAPNDQLNISEINKQYQAPQLLKYTKFKATGRRKTEIKN